MVSSNSSGSTAARPTPWNRRLRHASFISPRTGERSKRVFTLRDASHRLHEHGAADEATPLLHNGDYEAGEETRSERWKRSLNNQRVAFWRFWTSKTGIGILKCSLAYLLGSLATFVPAYSRFIGPQQDSKHTVATVIIWFHPARSIGSMHEAAVLAFFALCYSGLISFTSMGIATFFGSRDLLLLGHAICLIMFVGGGLGFIAWVKQRLGHPLVNMACAMAALGCIITLLKEGSVQAGAFSHVRVVQILMMVLMGVFTTTVVNLLVLPVTARGGLVADLENCTDLLGEMLISITRAFLSGRKYDLENEYFKKLANDHQASLASMTKNLTEAKREYLVIGKEHQYDATEKVANCLRGLSQDLGGLRSAAFAQFAFMDEHLTALVDAAESSSAPSRDLFSASFRSRPLSTTKLNPIVESPEHTLPERAHSAELGSPLQGSPPALPTPRGTADSLHVSTSALLTPGGTVDTSRNPSDMFLTFLHELGPPSKSLVYTLKQVLDELPFRDRSKGSKWLSWLNGPSHEVAINDVFISSLKQAIDLYSESRRKALDRLYQSRALNGLETTPGNPYNAKAQKGGKTSLNGKARLNYEVLADLEEVTACCGHFSFSLLDFAQDVLIYLDLLNELKSTTERHHRSWNWLILRKRRGTDHDQVQTRIVRGANMHDEERDLDPRLSTTMKKVDHFADSRNDPRRHSWLYSLHRFVQFFHRDDVSFAVKVGIGAILYSLPAFLQATRPFFVLWRGEWGLVSYMAICCMTIGASNTTGINRVIGTFIGANLAIIAWVCSSDHGDANPWLLGFFGWLVSLGCFYLIIAKGNAPMGRFILLTFNLGALYSYSLSVQDDDNDDDEGGIDPAIWDIVLHRFVAVVIGVVWGIIITRFIWPISARRKLKDGLCTLWLRMSLIWKRDPLAMFLLGEPRSSYMNIREEASLQTFLASLQSLRQAASSEFELTGPFPNQEIAHILECTDRMLGAFHAMNVVISKNLQYTSGEAAVLRYTRAERFELSARISHLYSVLASSIKLEYPLTDALPSIDHTRDRLLGKLSDFRIRGEGRELATEQDYELLYAYILVTGQLSQEIKAVSQEIENLYGTLNEDHLKLQ